MAIMPNPFEFAPCPQVAETAAACSPNTPVEAAAANPIDGPDIPMTVLMRRGFDPEQFLSDCEPAPLFLEGKRLGADDLMPVLSLLAGHM